MNIFVLSTDPKRAARWLCDKHVVKMPTETAQLLCVCFDAAQKAPYRPTHRNHPCAVWARSSVDNFEWLVDHGFALCAEYKRRYERVHAAQDVIQWCCSRRKKLHFAQRDLTPFAQAMPDVYKDPSAVRAYRAYYLHEKWLIATWKVPAEPPPWWPYAPINVTFPPPLPRSLRR